MIINHFSTFNETKNVWREVLKNAQIDLPFLLFEWQNSWWQCFGKGKTPHFLVVKKENTPLAILPLVEAKENLSFIGGDISDYLDIIVRKENKKEALELLLPYIFTKLKPKKLLLTNFSPHSTTPKVTGELAKELNLKVKKEKGIKTPSLILPKTWEKYLYLLSRKNRHELRRKQRRFQNLVGDPMILESENPARDIVFFLSLMRKSKPEKALFLTKERESFFKTLAREMPADVLDLVFLRIGKQNAAAILGFWGKSSYYLYNSGFNPKYKYLSAGLILKAFSIKRALERGLKLYDFMMGGERYKYQLGANAHWTWNLGITKL